MRKQGDSKGVSVTFLVGPQRNQSGRLTEFLQLQLLIVALIHFCLLRDISHRLYFKGTD